MKKLALTVALASLTLSALLASAAGADTFSGSCDIKGIAKFGKPLTGTKTANTYDFRSGDPTGGGGPDPTICSGTLNGQQVSNVPATATVAGPGNLSCAQSESTDPGTGELRLKNGNNTVTFPFKFEFSSVATEVDFTASGEGGGGGSGHASFAHYSPPEAPLECAGADANGDGGAGLPELGFDATFTSSTPLVGSTERVEITPVPTTSCRLLEGKAKRKCFIKKCRQIENKKKRAKCIAKVKGKKGRRG